MLTSGEVLALSLGRLGLGVSVISPPWIVKNQHTRMQNAEPVYYEGCEHRLQAGMAARGTACGALRLIPGTSD